MVGIVQEGNVKEFNRWLKATKMYSFHTFERENLCFDEN
jgi:hypothetical protein